MKKPTLFPAIRSYVGDWIYYATSMSFKDVSRLVSAPNEIHESQKLSDWIQREAIDSHAEDIAEYIVSKEQRFLGSLIVGVYNGQPDWAPLDIDFERVNGRVSKSDREKVAGKLGLLQLSGGENLFAVDGQHRVAGIKRALEKSGEVSADEVCVVFVAHDNTSSEGRIRTRRLFTTVNKKAKQISTAAKIALDEDDGFAIVTRRLIDEFWLFSDDLDHVLYSSGGAIPPANENAITSVVGLYELTKDLYLGSKKRDFKDNRPTPDEIESHFIWCTEFWETLLKKCPEYAKVFVEHDGVAMFYRGKKINHLLFRPIGQATFIRALVVLMNKRNLTFERAIEKLLDSNMDLLSKDWSHLLWDPIGEKMMMTKKSLAESQLLRLVNESARTPGEGRKLDEFLKQRDVGGR